MRKIKLKSGVNHAMLSTSEMKCIVGGIDEVLHCNCRLNINEKDESGNYKSIDVSEQIKKIGFIVCGGLLVLGGIFTFFTAEGFIANVAAKAGGTAQQVKDMWAALNAKTSCGLPIVSGILAILGGGAICASQFVPDKQF